MESLWIETTKDELKLNQLEEDEQTEVCIIGAGLFGLTTAYYLTLLGKKVTVLEKGEIGEKVSGNTTGKVTSQHGLFYDHLIKDYGKEYARKYLEANEEAIKNIKEIIDNEKIECEYTERKAYVYTTKQDEVIQIEQEIEAVRKIGKEAKLVTETKLPQGMYINDKPPIYSFRTAQYNGKEILLIAGSDHKTG